MTTFPLETSPATVRPAFTATTASMAASLRAEGEVDQLARILLAAYVDTPESEWVISDRDQRLAVYAAYWPAVLRYGLAHGIVDVAVDEAAVISGTAIWFDTTIEPADAYEQLLTTTCGAHADRFRHLHHLLTEHQPDHEPARAARRLAWIAVARDRQCQGIGGTLLAHRHTILDTERSAAQLTATTSGARALFARHGYRPTRTPLRLPGKRTFLWSMAREPRSVPEPGDRARARRQRTAISTDLDPGA